MIFKERFNELLKNVNIVDLAKNLQLNSISSIYKWKKGEDLPRINNLIAIANYFNCSIDYLLGRTDDFEKYNNKKIVSFDIQLNKILKEKHITKYKLIKENNFTKGHIFSWFNKKAYPSTENALKLADYLGVSIDYLVGRI